MTNAVEPPELLSPAGDRECLAAAIENGADAVYFGLSGGFNARERATNFTLDELPETFRTLHGRGVKGYVALNTLVFTGELAKFEETARRVAESGADAVLVQDLGAARLIRESCPGLAIHASTQMTLTSSECIAEAMSLGIERVVLARELSIEEIKQIRAKTAMPLEVFVHGALCVAYSGQCLTSESFGGRSANRGQCAQACRMPYDLVCDGKDVDLGEKKYLLSPQDLAAYDLTPELIAAGVCAFKIEGRLKTPEYVANITRHYRQAIDAAMAGAAVKFTREEIDEMELSFSRGFSPGWLAGNDHKMLVPAESSAKRGVLLGAVTRVGNQRVQVELRRGVKRGDGVAFEGGRLEKQEQGGRVYELFERGRPVASAEAPAKIDFAFAHGSIDFSRLRIGQRIWKTDDPELTRRWRKTFAGSKPLRRLPVDILATAAAGAPLRIVASCGGHREEISSEAPLAIAERHPLTVETLREQFGRLGNTAFELRELAADIAGEPMAPLSVLGAMRRQLIERLEAALRTLPPSTVSKDLALPRLLVGRGADREMKAPELRVLVRSLDQLTAALDTGSAFLYADFADIRQYSQAVERARAAGAKVFLATLRIQKPAEMGVFTALHKHGADGILARSLSALAYYRQHDAPLVADFSLNAANPIAVDELLRLGAAVVTASYDLNREQLLELVQAAAGRPLEVVVHQHMPMFHMEHCVFCSVLSPGTNSTNCGRPCDDRIVRLRDRLGYEHPLTADVGCRNTLFNATAQSGAEIVQELARAGVRSFRVELLDESPEETRRTIKLYSELISGRIAGAEVWRTLRAANRVGVTRGTLEEKRNPLAIL